MEPTSSRILVRFVTTEPQCELLVIFKILFVSLIGKSALSGHKYIPLASLKIILTVHKLSSFINMFSMKTELDDIISAENKTIDSGLGSGNGKNKDWLPLELTLLWFSSERANE